MKEPAMDTAASSEISQLDELKTDTAASSEVSPLEELRTDMAASHKEPPLMKELRKLSCLIDPYIHNSLLNRITPLSNKYGITSPIYVNFDITILLTEFKDELISSNPELLLDEVKPKLKKILTKRRIVETQIKDLVNRLKKMRENCPDEQADIEELIKILQEEFKPVYVSEDWVARFGEVVSSRKTDYDPIEENPELLLDSSKLQEVEHERKMLRGKENAHYFSELAELYNKKYIETEDISDQLLESLMRLKKSSAGTNTLCPFNTSNTLNLFTISYQRWTYMLKSHALYVSASLQDGEMRDEYIRKAVDVHKQTVMSVNEETLRDDIHGNINKLNTLRENHKTIVVELDNLSASIDVKKSDQEFIPSLFNFSERGESFLCQVSEDTKKFVSSIMSQSIESLSVQFPLCVFAIGSLARGEATSFSDIEFGFLVADSIYIDQLMSLSLDMFYRLNYLGESNLKTFEIAELRACGFSDDSPKGVRIDGISSKAGNMPSGNGFDPESELCFSVSSFFNKLSYAINNPHQLNSKNVRSDFADMVAHTSIVWANNEGAGLYHKMKSGVSHLPQTDLNRAARINLLESDMNSFNFLPDLADHSGQIDVKSDIYRYLSLYLAGVNNSLFLNCGTNFDCIRKMRELSLIVDDESMLVLKYLLVCSLHTRLAAYLHYGQQFDAITVFKTSSQSHLFYVNANVFTNMMAYMIPFKKSLLTALSKSDNIIKPIPSITHDNFTATAITLYYTWSHHELISLFEKKFGDSLSPDLMSSDQSEILVGSLYVSRSLTVRHSSLIQSAHGADSGDYDYFMGESLRSTQPRKALVHLKRSEKMWCNNWNELFRVYRSIAECYIILGEYTQCEEELDKLKQVLDRMDVSQIEGMIYKGLYLHVLSALRLQQCNYKQLLELSLEMLSIHNKLYGKSVNTTNTAATLNNIGLAYHQLGEYDLAHRYYKQALDMKYNLYGADSNNENIACTLMNLGTLHTETGDYTNALKYFTQSYDMRCIIYKHTPNHPDIALCSGHIAEYYYKQNQYETAIEWCNKELNVFQSQSDNDLNKSDYAICLGWLGRCYYELKQYETAVELYKKKLYVYQSQSDNDLNKSDYVTCLYWLGGCYYELSQYGEAVKYYCESYDIEVSLANNGDLSKSICVLSRLADVYFKTDQYKEAVIWFSKLSELFNSLSDVSSEDGLKVKSVCLHNIAVCYKRFDDERSVDYFKQSTELYPITGSDYISTAGMFKIDNTGKFHSDFSRLPSLSSLSD